jgi:Sec-independent protein translocase protein TatA
MFGLGVGELLLLGAIIALVGGPTAIPKIVRALRSVQKAKSELTGKALLGRLMADDDEPQAKPKPKRPRKKP